MLRNYPDTQATRDALPLMENAYRQMQLNAQADKVAKIIAANSKTPEAIPTSKTAAFRLPFFYSISDATEMISLQRIQSNMACFQPFLK